ncbi:unnamed protein product, partial [Sphenostylis stenocarpa]
GCNLDCSEEWKEGKWCLGPIEFGKTTYYNAMFQFLSLIRSVMMAEDMAREGGAEAVVDGGNNGTMETEI